MASLKAGSPSKLAPMRHTRLRSLLPGAPPIMSGLDDRETARDPVPLDPEYLSFDQVVRQLPPTHPMSKTGIRAKSANKKVRAEGVGDGHMRRHSAPLDGAQGARSTPTKILFPKEQFGHVNSPPLALPSLSRQLFGQPAALPACRQPQGQRQKTAAGRVSKRKKGDKKRIFIDESPSALFCPRYYNAVREHNKEAEDAAWILLSMMGMERERLQGAERCSRP
ncbi:hypothetical protein CDD82_3970 [Ophiocordyceps australis]|uniref:Uncharacterized protein n=1 Tax=Ophiocordyceps australis TaxID=1399860 RepID=A0A2C5Z9B1_9HYPO|nr:hypothetical protein CDD82_3970 [Ophiocordyceps australis]